MNLPSEYRKLVCVKVTPNFREAVSVVMERTPKLERGEVFLKTKYVGINASDVNITAARYWAATPPFNVGVESVAEVVAVGDDVTHLSVGSAVATINVPGFGAFSEYQRVLASKVLPIPRAVPDIIPLLISGLTASIGLDEQGRIKEGETVLITAAAGGLGHIAVQWAKAAKCHVIGTCSSPDKEEFLKSIGCDRVINYKTNDLGAELHESYPKGVDVIWETIGGKTFEVLLNHLSVRGRLVVVGTITGYQNNDNAFPDVYLTDLPSRLLIRSASVSGFFMSQYYHMYPEYMARLRNMLEDGKIVPKVDFGLNDDGAELKGLEGCVRGVEYLHSGKSIGKVVVKLD